MPDWRQKDLSNILLVGVKKLLPFASKAVTVQLQRSQTSCISNNLYPSFATCDAEDERVRKRQKLPPLIDLREHLLKIVFVNGVGRPGD